MTNRCFAALHSARLRSIVIAAIIVLCFASIASACPTCKEGLAENDPQGQRMVAGIYYSILFMMSMPFIILTTFGSFCYRAVRRSQIEHSASDHDFAAKSQP